MSSNPFLEGTPTKIPKVSRKNFINPKQAFLAFLIQARSHGAFRRTLSHSLHSKGKERVSFVSKGEWMDLPQPSSFEKLLCHDHQEQRD